MVYHNKQCKGEYQKYHGTPFSDGGCTKGDIPSSLNVSDDPTSIFFHTPHDMIDQNQWSAKLYGCMEALKWNSRSQKKRKMAETEEEADIKEFYQM